MIDFLFNPQGRISRKGYLVAYLAPMLFLTQIVSPVLTSAGLGVLTGVITIFYFWPGLVTVPVKRFHDMGLTGWYQLGFVGLQALAALILLQGLADELPDPEALQQAAPAEQQTMILAMISESARAQLGGALLALVGIAQMIFFLTVKGQPSKNRFGQDPHASGKGYAD